PGRKQMGPRVKAGRLWGRGIEWDAIRGLIASDARTPMGRERALTAEPLSNPPEVDEALDATAEARRALAQEGAPPLDGLSDPRPILDRAHADGSVLDGPELLALLPLLDAAPRLAAYARAIRPVAPRLAASAESLPRLADLRDLLRRALDDDGALTDRASARLGHVRRELRERRRRLVADLERLLQAEGERVFAERFVTVRHGRYVLPLRAESPGRPLLLITGPNAGGKTIALKTLALLSLMTQAGCHVPAAEGSRVPVFERIFAVIGDDQSVAENLSTFSAFIKQIREVLAEADGRSLVLLDELGAGTDPDEGAALARASLESLADCGALVLATTHLEPLRAFAAAEPRARNASV